MNVKIVAMTTPKYTREEINERSDKMWSATDIIAYCARVSNPQNQENFDTAEKLLNYCIDHQHWSPFEMVNVVMEINTTRDIARQILRHRSFSFQEFSQRYADPTQLGISVRKPRLQDPKNRQNSIDLDPTKQEHINIAAEWVLAQSNVLDVVMEKFKKALSIGIAKEQARAILPEGLTNSRLYMNGTLRSWIHYCLLRMGPETQKEHREIATEAWGLLKKEFSFLEGLYENYLKVEEYKKELRAQKARMDLYVETTKEYFNSLDRYFYFHGVKNTTAKVFVVKLNEKWKYVICADNKSINWFRPNGKMDRIEFDSEEEMNKHLDNLHEYDEK